MTKVDRALEMQVIDWLQWDTFEYLGLNERNLPGLALELIAKRKKENELLRHIILESKHKRSSEPLRPECSKTCYACWSRERLEELDKSQTGQEPEGK